MVQDIIDGIVGGLTEFIGGLGSSLLEFILSLIIDIFNIILTPINILISTFIPDLSIVLQNFRTTFDYVFTDLIAYMWSYVPPMTGIVIKTYITLLIGYYSVKYVYKGIVLAPKLIQKLKFW